MKEQRQNSKQAPSNVILAAPQKENAPENSRAFLFLKQEVFRSVACGVADGFVSAFVLWLATILAFGVLVTFLGVQNTLDVVAAKLLAVCYARRSGDRIPIELVKDFHDLVAGQFFLVQQSSDQHLHGFTVFFDDSNGAHIQLVKLLLDNFGGFFVLIVL
jgi:hypothetical protein